MRKLFTEDNLSTKSFTRWKAHTRPPLAVNVWTQICLLSMFVLTGHLQIHCKTDVTLTLFPFLKRRAFANPIAMNEDSIKGFIIAVFNSRHNKKETSTRRLTETRNCSAIFYCSVFVKSTLILLPLLFGKSNPLMHRSMLVYSNSSCVRV